MSICTLGSFYKFFSQCYDLQPAFRICPETPVQLFQAPACIGHSPLRVLTCSLISVSPRSILSRGWIHRWLSGFWAP